MRTVQFAGEVLARRIVYHRLYLIAKFGVDLVPVVDLCADAVAVFHGVNHAFAAAFNRTREGNALTAAFETARSPRRS